MHAQSQRLLPFMQKDLQHNTSDIQAYQTCQNCPQFHSCYESQILRPIRQNCPAF